jgi:hypothetical protein
MADAPMFSLARARELKIDELSTHFANDDLTLEELERRIELVYKAASAAELETITADLRKAAMVPPEFVQAKVVKGKGNAPATYELPRGRILSFMSSTRKVGRWALPRELELRAIMSDTHIDLTQAVLTDPSVVVQVRAIMASLKIVVPPGMRVVVDTNSIMSNVESRAGDYAPSDLPATTSAPVVRLIGYAFMSDVQVVVRRREDALVEGAEDEDD